MDEHDYEDLAEVWHKLQEAHLDFEQTPDSRAEYSRRYDAVVLALEEYKRVLEQMKPRTSPNMEQ